MAKAAVKTKGGHFNENYAYTAKDIRFTTKGKTLYAIALGWPEDGQLTVRSLARPDGESINQIQQVELLGHEGKLAFAQSTNGLVVTLPDQKVSEYTAALRITGTDLQAVPIVQIIEPVRPDARGNLNLLAADAELHGDQIKQEAQGGQPNIGFWDRADEWVSWKVQIPQAGTFNVSASCAAVQPASEFVVEIGGQQLPGKAAQTGSWDKFQVVQLGPVEIKQPGELIVTMRSKDSRTWKAINLRFVKLTKAD